MAAEAEERARARWLEADHRVRAAGREKEAVLERAGRLADEDLPAGLRGHLAQAGARHLTTITDERIELDRHAASRRGELDAAMTRLRSLERIVSRLDEAAEQQRRRIEEVDWRDLVAARTVRGLS